MKLLIILLSFIFFAQIKCIEEDESFLLGSIPNSEKEIDLTKEDIASQVFILFVKDTIEEVNPVLSSVDILEDGEKKVTIHHYQLPPVHSQRVFVERLQEFVKEYIFEIRFPRRLNYEVEFEYITTDGRTLVHPATDFKIKNYLENPITEEIRENVIILDKESISKVERLTVEPKNLEITKENPVLEMNFEMEENYEVDCSIFNEDKREDFMKQKLKRKFTDRNIQTLQISFPMQKKDYTIKCFIAEGGLGFGFYALKFPVSVVEESEDGKPLVTFVDEYRNFNFVEDFEPKEGVIYHQKKENLLETQVKICEDCSILLRLRKKDDVEYKESTFHFFNHETGYTQCYFTFPEGDGTYEITYFVDKIDSIYKQPAFVQEVVVEGVEDDATTFVNTYKQFNGKKFEFVAPFPAFMQPFPKEDVEFKVRADADVESIYIVKEVANPECKAEILKGENGIFNVHANYEQCSPSFSIRLKDGTTFYRVIDFTFEEDSIENVEEQEEEVMEENTLPEEDNELDEE